MGKDLFQIGNKRNIYLTMELWAMLSPRLARRERDRSLSKHNHQNEEERLEERRNSDVNQSC